MLLNGNCRRANYFVSETSPLWNNSGSKIFTFQLRRRWMKRIALLAVVALLISGCQTEGFVVDDGTPSNLDKLIAREKSSDKLLPVKVGGKFGYIDRDGKMAVNPQFDEASRFALGLAVVSVGSKYGYIDDSGKLGINPQFDRAESFFEGLAAVCTGDCRDTKS